MGWRNGFLGLVFAIGSLICHDAEACSNYRTQAVYAGKDIGILFDSTVDGASELVAEAITMWEGCSNYGHDFPRFSLNTQGTRTITLEFFPNEAGEGRCGSFGQERIRIYGFQRRVGGLVSCGNLVQNLAHELGHALGLSDGDSAQRCQLHVMSWINFDNAHRRRVQPGECAAVGKRWLTMTELESIQQINNMRVASLKPNNK